MLIAFIALCAFKPPPPSPSFFPLGVGSSWTYIEIQPSEQAIYKSYRTVQSDTLINDTLYHQMASIVSGKVDVLRLYREDKSGTYCRSANAEYLCIPSADSLDKPYYTMGESGKVRITVVSNNAQTATPVAAYDSLLCVKYENLRMGSAALVYLKKDVGIICTRTGDGELLSYLDSYVIR